MRLEPLLIFGLTLQPISSVHNQILETLNDHAAHGVNHEGVLRKTKFQMHAVPSEFPLVITNNICDQRTQIETRLGLTLLTCEFVKGSNAFVEGLELVLES